jgi:RNA polymerase sigma-70 factor (ECF subfamily)
MSGDAFTSGDEELVQQVAAGSQDALAALYDRHVGSIFALARRLTSDRQIAEEVVQETFLALWNRAELFRAADGTLRAWLTAIARNRAIDRLRAARHRPALVSPTGADDQADAEALERMAASGSVLASGAPPVGPQSAAEREWERGAVRQALETMPEDERMVIALAYDDELSQSEIAHRLDLPIGTVKTRTRRALRRLRVVLAPAFEVDPRVSEPGVRAPAAASVPSARGAQTDGSR